MPRQKVKINNQWVDVGIGTPIDATPTSGSLNAVSSNGVYNAIATAVPTKTSDLTNDSGFITGALKVTLSVSGTTYTSDTPFDTVAAALQAGRYVYLVDEENVKCEVVYTTASKITFMSEHLWEDAHVYYDLDKVGTSTLVTKTTDYYQPKLRSGYTIKTINNVSVLGSGNIEIQSGANIQTYSAELGTTWVKDTTANWYTQEVSVVGILSTDTPDADVDLSGCDTAEEIEASLVAWGKIFKVTTSNGSITVYAGQPTESAIDISLRCIR